MSDPLHFNFPFPLLLQEGDTIVSAAEANAADSAHPAVKRGVDEKELHSLSAIRRLWTLKPT